MTVPAPASEVEILQADYRQFAHCVSHALRDPVRKILYSCEVIQDEDVSPQALQNGLNSIEMQAQELLQKLDAMYQYSLMLTPAIKGEVALQPIVESLITEVEPVLRSRNIRVIRDVLPTVSANREHMITLYKALLDNALRHGGAQLSQIRITAEPTGKGWTLGVHDNGTGMDRVYNHIVFMLFERINIEVPGGLGTGLAFARKIVELYGGNIWYDSEEGKGTSVFFTIA